MNQTITLDSLRGNHDYEEIPASQMLKLCHWAFQKPVIGENWRDAHERGKKLYFIRILGYDRNALGIPTITGEAFMVDVRFYLQPNYSPVEFLDVEFTIPKEMKFAQLEAYLQTLYQNLHGRPDGENNDED